MKKFSALAAVAAAGIGASASADFVINEFVANHVGADTFEYIEIFGTPNTSLSSLRILQIEGDGASAGLVDTVDAPTTTDAAGFWWTGFRSDRYENGTVSFFLVSGWTGSTGMDLDTNNDGVLDLTPWGSALDRIGVHDGGATDFSYANVTLTAAFDGGAFTVGGASRIPNGVDTNTVGDWKRNDFDLAGIDGFTGTPDNSEAYNTPGSRNTPVPAPGALALFGLGAVLCRRR